MLPGTGAHRGCFSFPSRNRHIVSRDEHDGNAEPCGESGIHATLPDRSAIDLKISDDAAACMREQPARGIRFCVIADEERRVEGFVQTLEHAVALEAVAY